VNYVIWVWSVAGAFGVLFSVSIFYQKLDLGFSVYRKLAEKDIVQIISDTGEAIPSNKWASFCSFYNELIFMGRTGLSATNFEKGTTIQLQSGEQLQLVMGETFYEVRKTKKNGKYVHFRLFAKQI
jgi:hypothetical protein